MGKKRRRQFPARDLSVGNEAAFFLPFEASTSSYPSTPLLPSANALTGKAASARSERERGKWLKVGPQQSIHTRACLVRTVQQYRAREKEKGELCSSSPASAAASRRYPFSFSEPLAVVFILVCRHSSSFRWENRIDRARGGERVSPRGGFLGTTSRTCVHTVGGGGGSPRERIWHNEGEREHQRTWKLS